MSTKKRANYLSNTHLLEELKIYNETGEFTDRLARMFMLLAKNVSNHRWFRGYSYVDELINTGVELCTRKIDKFDISKGSNAFAYFTQITWNGMRQFCIAEKKQQDIRDALLLENNMNPSFNFKEKAKENY